MCFVVATVGVWVCFAFRVVMDYMKTAIVRYAVLCYGASGDDVIFINECEVFVVEFELLSDHTMNPSQWCL